MLAPPLNGPRAPATANPPGDVPTPREPAIRYLLALNAGATEGPDGHLYTDPSWAHDLVEHAVHFPQMTFLAPVHRRTPNASEVVIPDAFHRVVRYRGFGGRFVSYLAIPSFLLIFSRELRRTDIVHTCIAGKPFPIGWIIVPLAKIMRVKVAIVVESAFWRLNPGERPTLRRRLSAAIWERANRWCLRQADYAAYQHDQDRKALPAPRAARSVLYQASWINETDIVDREVLERRLRAHRERPRLSVIFVSRMVAEKGTGTVAELFAALADDDIDITFMGTGPELATLRVAASRHANAGRYREASPIAYGPLFLENLEKFDVVMVPSLSDEQPRIVYDAYARGLVVVGSRTPGLMACIEDGVTGLLVPPGDTDSLATTLRTLARDRERLHELALGGLRKAASCTHHAFHEARARDIAAVVRPHVCAETAVIHRSTVP